MEVRETKGKNTKFIQEQTIEIYEEEPSKTEQYKMKILLYASIKQQVKSIFGRLGCTRIGAVTFQEYSLELPTILKYWHIQENYEMNYFNFVRVDIDRNIPIGILNFVQVISIFLRLVNVLSDFIRIIAGFKFSREKVKLYRLFPNFKTDFDRVLENNFQKIDN